PHDFDVVWASPPCTEYSMAKTTGVKNIETANRKIRNGPYISFDTLIRSIGSSRIRRPVSSMGQEFMTDLPFKDVDYCKYDMPYRKRTRLWSNIECWDPRPLCHKDCNSISDNGRMHNQTTQRRPPNGRESRRFGREELYKVPEDHISEICASIAKN
ncbi:MAG: hypothetical protein ACKPKO_29195, partial [Candidatus Fonsibacter sp.]